MIVVVCGGVVVWCCVVWCGVGVCKTVECTLTCLASGECTKSGVVWLVRRGVGGRGGRGGWAEREDYNRATWEDVYMTELGGRLIFSKRSFICVLYRMTAASPP